MNDNDLALSEFEGDQGLFQQPNLNYDQTNSAWSTLSMKACHKVITIVSIGNKITQGQFPICMYV